MMSDTRQEERMATIEDFAQMLQEAQAARFAREYPNSTPPRVSVKPGPKYTKIDVGDSGKYMIVNATGEILGIKAYGVPHRGHRYGTLDTIHEWDWSGYAAVAR